ncbi:MAG: type I-B CRISPR-associated protein Cas7/Csh2 [Methanothermobacter sp.]|nr:type I-B CRISPR-associated protein Cas7/Csh2 [Methanothermobacter sp.]
MNEENLVKNRSEIVFLYDIKDANPNGDPLDENKPRIDEDTEINIVTDVRLKRTIRDYFLSLIEKNDKRLKGQKVFVKEVRDEEGYLYDAKTRANQFLEKEGSFSEMKEAMKEDICSKCIDVRLFGGVIPIEPKVKGKKQRKKGGEQQTQKGSIALTGPVQFRFGRSLHKVDVKFIKGTGAFAAEYEQKKKMQFTFREEYILPYSLIAFYGIVNENAAKATGITNEDVNLLLEGLWNGTKNLITRSKIGQVPRLLLNVVYKENNFHIGDLEKKINLMTNKDEKEIREISEIKLNISRLIDTLKDNKDKIERIDFKADKYVNFVLHDREFTGEELENVLEEITQVNELDL